MSVTSSGRSSTSRTMRCTSGLFASMEWAICFMTVVLPALGGETIMPRWPLPIGESRSTMRAVRLSLSPDHLEVEARVGEQRRQVLEPGPVAGLLGVEPRHGVDAQQGRVLLVVRGGPACTLDVVAPAQRELPRLADRDVHVLRTRAGTPRSAGSRSPRRAGRACPSPRRARRCRAGPARHRPGAHRPGHGRAHDAAGCGGCRPRPPGSDSRGSGCSGSAGCGCPAGSAPDPVRSDAGAGDHAVGELGRLDEDGRPGVAGPAHLGGGGTGGREGLRRCGGGRPGAGLRRGRHVASAGVGRTSLGGVGADRGAAGGERVRRDGLAPFVATAPASPLPPSAAPEVTPVASRI